MWVLNPVSNWFRYRTVPGSQIYLTRLTDSIPPPADFFSSVPTVSSVDEMRLLMVYSTTFLEKSVQFREITANVLFGSQKTRLSVLSRTKRSDSLKRAEVPNGILANRLVARASGSGNF